MAATGDAANHLPKGRVLALPTTAGERAEPRERGPIQALLLSEIRLHREGLAAQLAGEQWVRVAATASTIAEVAGLAARRAIDIVLLDLPPTRENLRALGRAATATPAVRFIVLGGVTSESDVIAWAEAGAAAMVEPGGSMTELRAVLESAMRGELRCSPQVAAALLRRVRALAPGPEAPPGPGQLTAREWQILELIAEGLTNKEIARRLGIRLATVKNHVHSILEKLNVHSRAAAIAAVRVRPPASGR